MVLLQGKSGDQQSQQAFSSGDHECLYKIEIFQFGPKCWNNPPTN